MDSEIFTLIFSGTVAISTVFYVILTRKLVHETRETRKFYETPFLVASLDFAENGRNVIQLKIKNIGLGYAQNISFRVYKDYEWVDNQPLAKRGAFKNGIQSFPPNYELIYTIYIGQYGNENPLTENDFVEFDILYHNIHQKLYSNRFKLKFNEITGQGYSTPPLNNENAKVYYLGEINKQLEKINKRTEK